MGKARNGLVNFYWRVKKYIAPGLSNSQFNYRDSLKTHIRDHSRWLDLGCGHQILPDWMPSANVDQSLLINRSEMVVGLDADLPSLKRHNYIQNKVLGDIRSIPFVSESFNIVSANMVVEHIENPDGTLAELHRVLEPEGIFIFHTPNAWNYAALFARLVPSRFKDKFVEVADGRSEEDIFPTNYKMNTHRMLRKLAKRNNFEIIELNMVESSPISIVLGPIVIIELLIKRILMINLFKNLRSNIIAVLRKR